MRKIEISRVGAAFLDGFSLAGFLEPLRRPGAPTQLFADPAPKIDSNVTLDLNDSLRDLNATPADLEKAKRLLVRAGFQVIPGTAVGAGQRL